MTIADWLHTASTKLKQAGIDSYRLDSELILEFVYKKNKTYLHAHSTDKIAKNVVNKANKLLNLRLKRVPIAYIFGYKEFYGRNFIVSKKVLIPRPESEAIVNFVKKISKDNIKTILDVGCGSGCVGLTIKLECPGFDVSVSDISNSALKIAKLNAKNLDASVNFIKSDLLNDTPEDIDVIVANLPYVDKSWPISPDTKYEPTVALYADDEGLEIIKRLIQQSKSKYLILESDPRQQNAIIEFSKKYNYKLLDKDNYVVCLKADRHIWAN